jgi:hypothetical protein
LKTGDGKIMEQKKIAVADIIRKFREMDTREVAVDPYTSTPGFGRRSEGAPRPCHEPQHAVPNWRAAGADALERRFEVQALWAGTSGES